MEKRLSLVFLNGNVLLPKLIVRLDKLRSNISTIWLFMVKLRTQYRTPPHASIPKRLGGRFNRCLASWFALTAAPWFNSLSEAVRYLAVFYDGVVVPGALILLSSGTWFTIQYLGGLNFINVHCLTGMTALFAFERIEGNTIKRLYFMNTPFNK